MKKEKETKFNFEKKNLLKIARNYLDTILDEREVIKEIQKDFFTFLIAIKVFEVLKNKLQVNKF